ncbi:hypothetical protein BJY52DRAFT_1114318, partial [Lactarius psammicola]
CLTEKKPVMWYCNSMLFLFMKEGVYQASEHVLSLSFKTLVWILVNSNSNLASIPPHLAVDDTKHFLIFTSSPRESDHFILCSAIIYRLTDNDHRHVDELYDQLGPTPRICFNFLKNNRQLKDFEDHHAVTLIRLSLKQLQEIVWSDTTGYTINKLSHTILLVK